MTDWDSYFMPGTETLLNKPGIVDPKQLQQYEYERSGVRALELAEQPIHGRFDLAHMRAIHKHLFQDVYPWAGEIRIVGIEKGGSVFAFPSVIESYGGQIFRQLAKENHLKGLGLQEFAEGMGRHYTEINRLHPFREGNGRSTRVFMEQLASEAGYRLDFRRVDAVEWNAAARDCFKGNTGPIIDVFATISVPARAIAFAQEDRSQALPKHPELAIAYEALDKAAADARATGADSAQLQRFLERSKAVLVDALASGKLGAPERAQTRIEPQRDWDRG